MAQAANLHILFGSHFIQSANFEAVGKNQLDAPLHAGSSLAAQFLDLGEERSVDSSACFDFQETAIGAALFFEIAEGRDIAIFEDQHLVATLFHVAQQVRRQDQVQIAAVANLLNELDHASTGGRVEPVGGFIEEQKFRPVRDGLREFGGLLHAQRVGAEIAIANFAEADVEEGFVCAFECVLAWQAGQFRHHPDEVNAAHRGDEGIVLRHVADQAADFAGMRPDVATQDASGARRRLMKPKQGVEEGGLSCPVRPQQADRSTSQ